MSLFLPFFLGLRPKYTADFKDTKEKKGDTRTKERTNLVTTSLLELLVAAKNPKDEPCISNMLGSCF